MHTNKKELPKATKIKEVIIENPEVKTFEFDAELKARPGQFVMAWLPELDEKPFSFSCTGKNFAITVQKRGKFTEKMHSLKKGDLIGIRGPYGNGFTVNKLKKAIVIAGGCGTAVVLPLIKELHRQGTKVSTILGFRSKKLVFFEKELKKYSEVVIATDDGSHGVKGFATNILAEQLSKSKPDTVFGCGPEIMLKIALETCEKHKISCQLSLERYMKCGIGICGSCAIDGLLVCKDGPVFNEKQLAKLKEFVAFAYSKEGKRLSLKEYLANKGSCQP